MPHLFLHLHHGRERVEDLEGADFDSLEAAREEAVAAAREIMSDRVRSGQSPNDSQFEIADESGKILLMFPFHDAISWQ